MRIGTKTASYAFPWKGFVIIVLLIAAWPGWLSQPGRPPPSPRIPEASAGCPCRLAGPAHYQYRVSPVRLGFGELRRWGQSDVLPVGGLGGDGVRGQQLVLLAGPRDVRVELAQRHEPHRAARQVDPHVVAAALLGPADQCGLDARRAEVTGDEVVHHRGRGELRLLRGALFGGEPGDAQRLHVEPTPVGPRSVVAVGAYRGVDDPRTALGQFLWRHAQVSHLVAAVAFHEHVRVGGQLVGPLEGVGLSKVQPCRRGEPGAGILA